MEQIDRQRRPESFWSVFLEPTFGKRLAYTCTALVLVLFLTPVVGRQLLRCDRCHRTEEVTHADLMQYLLKGWPSCCGEVIALVK